MWLIVFKTVGAVGEMRSLYWPRYTAQTSGWDWNGFTANGLRAQLSEASRLAEEHFHSSLVCCRCWQESGVPGGGRLIKLLLPADLSLVFAAAETSAAAQSSR